jgi:hypothetical protein
MDSMLVIIGFCCMLIGVIGSFLPVVPGAPMSWIGLALLYFTTVIPVLDSQHYIIGNHYHFNIRIYYPVSKEQNDSEEVPMAFGEQMD